MTGGRSPTKLYLLFRKFRKFELYMLKRFLDRVLSSDSRSLGLRTGSPLPNRSVIASAADALDEAWRASLGKETPAAFSHAHNAALAFYIIGHYQKSARLLDAAFASGCADEETKRLRLSLFARDGSIPEALNLANTLSDTPMSRVIRAQLTVRTDPALARDILSDREAYTDKTNIIGAADAVVDSFLAESKFEEARLEAKRLEKVLPDDPEALIAMYRVLSTAGDAEAWPYLKQAIARIGPETPTQSRILVADCLSQAERDDDVVDLLYGSVDYSLDSFALRLLIRSAANADRRKILSEALAAIPNEIRNLPFYRRARTAWALCTGNIGEAEQEVRGFLSVQPRDLHMHLQLLQILARKEKIDELRLEVARSAADFDGAPQQFVFLAQFKDKFGSWQEAYDIAYRCWLSNQSDAAVCLAYTGLFFRPGHSKELDIAPEKVGAGMGVSIANTDGNKEIYLIEPDQSLRPGPRYLSPDHELAVCLLKHKVGDNVDLPDGSGARILWIKPKYLHALHEILESFGNVFPEVSGIEKVRLKTEAPGGFQPIFDRLRSGSPRGAPEARSHTRTVPSQPPETTTGRPSSVPSATEDTPLSWPRSGSPRGAPEARSHTRTVPSSLPETTTGRPSSVPSATEFNQPSWPRSGSPRGAPEARSRTRAVPSSLPETTTGRPSSVPSATEFTLPLWPRSGSPRGAPEARSHTRTVSS